MHNTIAFSTGTTAMEINTIKISSVRTEIGEKMPNDNIFYKTVTEVVAEADNPITDIVVKGEKVFSVCTDSNWEVERIYTSYISPVDGLIIVMHRKEAENDRADI